MGVSGLHKYMRICEYMIVCGYLSGGECVGAKVNV